MGYFVLPPSDNPSPKSLVKTAKINIELYEQMDYDESMDYLLSFAIGQLEEAITKIKKKRNKE